MFIIGRGNITTLLKREQAKYRDMYFVDCKDGYYDLSDKVHKNETILKIQYLM